MGRAARANPRTAIKAELTDGPQNPAAPQLLQRSYDLDAWQFAKMRKQGQTPLVRLAGRVYAVDKNGTFRRVDVIAERQPQGPSA